ncbi:MAG: D-2-hydroxyacid dehydrogenase [Candidatus Marinimicrobia bacterium]|nr:D-2-hydroxyacid dehydrogenase [Candidatus Neomarinimicrobiota bacterium]
MTRLVVLDGYTLNPGDLSWDAMAALGELEVHERTPPDQVLERAAGAGTVLTNKTVLGADLLQQLPDLRYIGVLATGYNVVDIAAAAAQGIVVTNVPSYGTESVAQMVFAHVLNLTQRVADHAKTVHDGRWSESRDFCYWDYPLLELSGRIMGVVGLGRIGRRVAQIAAAFGMEVLGFDPALQSADSLPVELVDLDALLRRSDVVSLHCPLTDHTRGLINRERLGWMKPRAFLINTSRGPLVDQQALAKALASGDLAGAGLDVLDEEPPPADNPLLSAPRCFVTPHIAWATREARQRLMNIAVQNVQAFLRHEPVNVITPFG